MRRAPRSRTQNDWVAWELAERLGVPLLELDSIRHLACWTELPDDEFVARVDAFTAATHGWVVDGNYSVVRDAVVWPRADTVVWLDLPRPMVMRQVVRRSVARVALRRELWNGNRERWRNLLSLDPAESIIRWAWTSPASNRERYEAAVADPAWASLDVVRLRSRREVRAFLAGQPSPRWRASPKA